MGGVPAYSHLSPDTRAGTPVHVSDTGWVAILCGNEGEILHLS